MSILIDKSLSSKTVSLMGGAAVDTVISPRGTYPLKLATTGDYAEIQRKESGWYFGTNDFTIEGWFRFNNISGRKAVFSIWVDANNNFTMYYIPANPSINFNVMVGGNYSFATGISNCNLLIDTWYHIVLSRTSGTLKFFLDGVDKTISYVYGNGSENIPDYNASFILGYEHSNNVYLDGYTDEIRISKGIGRYTAAFTPSTTRFVSDQYTTLLLHGDSFLDSSYDNHNITATGATINTTYGVPKIGNGCFDFSSGSKYLTVPYRDDFYLADRDFTIEGWFNFTTLRDSCLIGNGYNTGFLFYYNHSSNYLDLYYLREGSTYTSLPVTWTATTNTWYHLTVVRANNILKFFVNGVQIGANQAITDIIAKSANELRIGADPVSSDYLVGYVDGLRISKGIARYTSNFTSSLIDFDRRENFDLSNRTKLLIKAIGDNGSQSIKDDSKWNRDITVNGNVKMDSTKGDYAFYFDGTGDYLSIPFSSDWVLGVKTNKWCIEFNYYPETVLGSDRNIIQQELTGAPYTGWLLYHQVTSNKLRFLMYDISANATVIIDSPASALTVGQWQNVCLLNDGINIKMFINGALVSIVSSIDIQTSAEPLKIGYTGGEYLKGWLSNLRIVRDDIIYSQNVGFDSQYLASYNANLKSVVKFENNALLIDELGDKFVNNSGNVALNASGKNGYCAYFPSSSVDFLYRDNFPTVKKEFAVSFWVKPDVASLGTSIAMIGFSNWYIDIRTNPANNDKMYCERYDGTHNPIINSNATFNNNQWNHVVVTSDGTTLSMFVNGGTAETVSDTYVPNDSSQQYRIGRRSATQTMWGAMDEVYFWDRGITANEATELYNSGSGRFIDTVNNINPLPMLNVKDSDTSCKLALRFNNDVVDSSPSGRTVTNNGVTFSSTDKILGSHSANFSGTNNTYLESLDSDDWDFGTSAFTIEFWVNYTSVGTMWLINHGGTGYAVDVKGWAFYQSGSGLTFRIHPETGEVYTKYVDWTPTTSTWYHLAVVRDSNGLLSFYVNGSLLISEPGWNAYDATAGNYTLRIGASHSADGGLAPLNGKIDELKIYKGIAKYTSNFNPYGERLKTLQFNTLPVESITDGIVTGNDSNTKLLLHLNNDFKDYAVGTSQVNTATVNGTVTIDKTLKNVVDGSAVFGSSSYLSIPDSDDFTFGSGDFCLETWIRPPSSSQNLYVFNQTQNTTNYWKLVLSSNTNAYLEYVSSGVANIALTAAGGGVTVGSTWYHVVLNRTGNTWRFFLNGVSKSVSLDAGSWSATLANIAAPFEIGTGFYNGTRYYSPSGTTMQEIKIVKGSNGGYTSNFTPPILPYISNTSNVIINSIADKLVACYKFEENQMTRDSGISCYDLTPVGSNLTTVAGKSGKCVNVGTDSYFTSPAMVKRPNYTAISCWVNMTAYTGPDNSGIGLFGMYADSGTGTWEFYLSLVGVGSRPYVDIFEENGTRHSVSAFDAQLSLNTWHHVFLYLEKNTGLFCYYDGVKYKIPFTSGDMRNVTLMRIGTAYGNPQSYELNGKMDEFYIWDSSSALFLSETQLDAFVVALYNNGNGKFIVG